RARRPARTDAGAGPGRLGAARLERLRPGLRRRAPAPAAATPRPGRAAAGAAGGAVRPGRRTGAAVDAVADRAHRPRARPGAARLAPPGRALRPCGAGPRRARACRRLGAA